VRAALLVAGFGLALGLRVVAGGEDVARSVPAGLLFAACLLALSFAAGARMPVTRRAAKLGLVGLLVVCLPVALVHLVSVTPVPSTQGFLPWAAAVAVVATAEELFLRGALFDALVERWGQAVAVGAGAVLFALMHVPLYGWHVLPLDLAVGVVLGVLRVEAGTPAAPALAHVGADWVGWFLR
jgi:membrane protease YdiL (CAAX protease family)